MIEVEIGKYVEKGVNFLSTQCSPIFNFVRTLVSGIVGFLQQLLNYPNPFIMIIIISFFAYWIKARKKGAFTKKGFKNGIGLGSFSIIGLLLLNSMGFWTETMNTIALIISASFLALLLGIPLGIWASRNDTFASFIKPVLDFMQTMPAFVYLIPAILLFNVGNVPGVIATVVFSLPPAVRLTNLGIREVQEDAVEAARSFGCTGSQLLMKVQIPLAMPTIMTGVNQVIMLALSMVVIASMVGARGLGQLVYKGILQARMGLGFEAGLGIVIIAILLDRISQALSTNN